MFRTNPFGFILALLLVPLGIGIVIFVIWHLKNKANRLVITNTEVLYEKGLFSKQRSEISMSSIRTVKVYQSFLNRVTGVGNIELYTAGDSPEIVVKGLPEPNSIREHLKMGQQAAG